MNTKSECVCDHAPFKITPLPTILHSDLAVAGRSQSHLHASVFVLWFLPGKVCREEEFARGRLSHGFPHDAREKASLGLALITPLFGASRRRKLENRLCDRVLGPCEELVIKKCDGLGGRRRRNRCMNSKDSLMFNTYSTRTVLLKCAFKQCEEASHWRLSSRLTCTTCTHQCTKRPPACPQHHQRSALASE